MNRKTLLSTLIAATLAGTVSLPAHAGKVEQLEAMLVNMQAQMDAMRSELDQAKRQATEASVQAAAATEKAESAGLPGNVQITGVLDVRANHVDAYAGGTDSEDIFVKEAGIAIDAQIHEMVSSHIYLKYEEDANGDNPEIDEATITVGNFDVFPLALTVGKTYAFGNFETMMVSDPMTLDLGETRMTLARVDFEQDGFAGGVYVFNGDANKAGENADEINHWGGSLGYAFETEDSSLDIGIDYLSNLGDARNAPADNVAGLTSMVRDVPALGLHAIYATGPFRFIGEYVGATKAFDVAELAHNGSGAEPSAWNLEVGYAFEVGGRESNIALGYGGTDEAAGLGLAEKRIAATWGVNVYDNTWLAFEWLHETDYGTGDSFVNIGGAGTGTGDDQDTMTVQLAVEF